jgi:hypothetical protein
MRKLSVALLLSMALAMPVHAQSNDDDYTPLGSRIKRDRQFPTELEDRFKYDQRSKVDRERSKDMMAQISACLYKRAGPDLALGFLDKTDFGFSDFRQINLDVDRAQRIYGFTDCLDRVADANNAQVQLRWTPNFMRQWMLEEAYFSKYRDKPTWIKPGYVVSERTYPLSARDRGVRAAMDFADCVVAADPYGADYFYRIPDGSPNMKDALNALMPALGPCLPQGQKMQVSPYGLRVWLGEALWHASNHNAPPAPEEPKAAK